MGCSHSKAEIKEGIVDCLSPPAVAEDNSQYRTPCNLVVFAEECDVFLDTSRLSFLEKQDKTLKDLVEGRLSKKNRFRQLLLGLKAVGKSCLLDLLRDYTLLNYPSIVVVLVSYATSRTSLSNLLLDELVRENICTEDTRIKILSMRNITEKVRSIENLVIQSQKHVLFLIDEFHLVYREPANIGVNFVFEVAAYADSTLGANHMIVTGSSTELRRLAFAKLKHDIGLEYPSYTRNDLNSTKLQPHWIFPVVDAVEFRKLTQVVMKTHDNAEREYMRFVCSGGRPGLVDNTLNPDDIPYSLTVKAFSAKNDIKTAVLLSLLECNSIVHSRSGASSPVPGLNSDDEMEEEPADKDAVATFGLEEICTLLRPVHSDTVWRKIQERSGNQEFAFDTLSPALFDLADDGFIIFHDTVKQISLTGGYLFSELEAIRHKDATLSWKECAALKMPTGIFHVLAEEVAERDIRNGWETIFHCCPSDRRTGL